MILRSALALTVLAVISALTGGAAGASLQNVELTIADKARGDYHAVGIPLEIHGGAKASAFVKAHSLTGLTELAELREPEGLPPGYATKYFKKNGTNITAAVKGEGFTFVAKPQAKRFRVQIKRTFGSDETACIRTQLEEEGGATGMVVAAVNQDPLLDCF